MWHENYHISLVATATHEIFIFIPIDENKSFIYRKKLEYPLYVFFIVALKGFVNYIIDGENMTAAYTSSP
jgi:hypothetical protein